MVRLVFRPYTQVRRSICTLESLRTSTRVSPGFALLRHSSPSFGSQHVCSHSNLSPGGSWSVDSAAKTSYHSSKRAFTLIPRLGVHPEHSHTCKTPWSVFQDGLIRGISSESLESTTENWPIQVQKPLPHSQESLTCWVTSNTRQHCLPSVPFQQFQVLFHSLFKVLCIFPSRYLFAIGLPPIFSFRWNLPPN